MRERERENLFSPQISLPITSSLPSYSSSLSLSLPIILSHSVTRVSDDLICCHRCSCSSRLFTLGGRRDAVSQAVYGGETWMQVVTDGSTRRQVERRYFCFCCSFFSAPTSPAPLLERVREACSRTQRHESPNCPDMRRIDMSLESVIHWRKERERQQDGSNSQSLPAKGPQVESRAIAGCKDAGDAGGDADGGGCCGAADEGRLGREARGLLFS